MESEPLYCNPFNQRVLSAAVAISGHRQEAIEDETAGVIADGRLRSPGHEKRTV